MRHPANSVTGQEMTSFTLASAPQDVYRWQGAFGEVPLHPDTLSVCSAGFRVPFLEEKQKALDRDLRKAPEERTVRGGSGSHQPRLDFPQVQGRL